MKPVLYTFRRCPYAMRARLAIDVSGVSVELREILLRDKPAAMLEASPKGTVPVVVNGDRVIDESFDIMLWALAQNDPEGWLRHRDDALIGECDGAFKTALDAYKYGQGDISESRENAAVFLSKLDTILAEQTNLGGDTASLTDMSIVTFVRQYAHVDQDWFYGEPWPHLIRWLDDFKASDRFARIMQKYPLWQPDAPAIIFPEAA